MYDHLFHPKRYYLWLLLLLTILLPKVSRAQYIGDRAIGMGGAQTALAMDPAASWYNPAGLVRMSQPMLTISGNAYTYRRMNYQDYIVYNDPGPGNSSASFQATSITAFPSTIAYGWLSSGYWRHGLAFSLLIPSAKKGQGSILLNSRRDVVSTTFETNVDMHDYDILISSLVNRHPFPEKILKSSKRPFSYGLHTLIVGILTN